MGTQTSGINKWGEGGVTSGYCSVGRNKWAYWDKEKVLQRQKKGEQGCGYGRKVTFRGETVVTGYSKGGGKGQHDSEPKRKENFQGKKTCTDRTRN